VHPAIAATGNAAQEAVSGDAADTVAKHMLQGAGAAGAGQRETLAAGEAKRQPSTESSKQAKPTAADPGGAAGAAGAADSAQTTPVSAISDAKADTRQRGDGQTAARVAATPAPPSSTSAFETQVRLTADPPALDRATATRAAAATTAAGAADSTTPLDGDVSRQIVQSIRLQWSQGVGTARVTLQPDYLGDLSIDIRVDHGAVTAVLDASSASVRQWLEGHEPLLRQGLSDQGLTLDRLVIKQDPPQPSMSGGQQQGQEREEPQRRQPREAPTDATFEVVM
jgi:flagellar hook-length control protein FliK